MLKKTFQFITVILLCVVGFSYENVVNAADSTDLIGVEKSMPTMQSNIASVLKIHSYIYSQSDDYYNEYSYGSAVSIGGNKILTNAHVVLDYESNPIGNYEICQTLVFRQDPTCFSTAKLLYYDIDKDIAILELDQSIATLDSVKIGESILDIGDSIELLGYPENGNNTITLTTGKISGYSQGYYKTDAGIDSGNSGGGAFNEKNEFVGIPTAGVVGLTTLGLIVPISDINNFLDKKGNITIHGIDTSIGFKRFIETRISVLGKKSIDSKFLNADDFKKYNLSMINFDYYEKKDLYSYTFLHSDNKTQVTLRNTQSYGNDFDLTNAFYESTKYLHNTDSEYKTIIKTMTLDGKKIYVYGFIDLYSNDIYLEFAQEGMILGISGNIKNKTGLSDALKFYLKGVDVISELSEKNISQHSDYGVKFEDEGIMGLYETISIYADFGLLSKQLYIQGDNRVYDFYLSKDTYLEADQGIEDFEFLENPYTAYIEYLSDDFIYGDENYNFTVVTNSKGLNFLVMQYNYEEEDYIEVVFYTEGTQKFTRFSIEGTIIESDTLLMSNILKILDNMSIVEGKTYLGDLDKRLVKDISNILK